MLLNEALGALDQTQQLRLVLCIATVSAAGSCEVHEAAFQKTLGDPELIAEADPSKLNIVPISGAELCRMILESYRCRPAKS
jgi:hypothetical protein